MNWTVINSPTDLPDDYKPVLVSSGTSVGFGYYRLKESYPQGFRQDGWVILWPCTEVEFKVIKYAQLPPP